MNEEACPSLVKEEVSNRQCHTDPKLPKVLCESWCFSSNELKGSDEEHQPRVAAGNLCKQYAISSISSKGSYNASRGTGSVPCNNGSEDVDVESKFQLRLENEGEQDVCKRCSDGLGPDGKWGSCPELDMGEAKPKIEQLSDAKLKSMCATNGHQHPDATANGGLVGGNHQQFHLSEVNSQDCSPDLNGDDIEQYLDGDSNQDFHPDPIEVKEEYDGEVNEDSNEEMDEETGINEYFSSRVGRDDSVFQLDCSGDQKLDDGALHLGASHDSSRASILPLVPDKPYRCSECGKCFGTSSILGQHCRIHSGEKPYKCGACGKCFSRGSTFLQHQQTHTGEKPYMCPHCGRCFSRSSNLIQHQRVHTGEKPYKCNTCGKSFSLSSTLIHHQIIHTGEKPYKCLDCGKCFNWNSNLLNHRRVHTGERSFVCRFCSKRFPESSSLTQHLRTHTGERPFRCNDCGKTFSLSSTLIQHQVTHIGERP